MEVKGKELKVSAIKDGTVIDHIPSDSLFRVISILGLKKMTSHMSFGTNLDSKKLGSKAIIKISDRFFNQDDINKIALLAPSAKLSIIRDYKVVEKTEARLTDEISGIVKCVNPKCITNNEDIITKFTKVDSNEIGLKCHYCEKITSNDNLFVL